VSVRAPRPGWGLAVLYATTSFVGAGLLFLVEPMVAHQILPLFGGSAMVWNTASMFFQLTLLTGYALTHALASRLRVRRHAVVQAVLVLLPVATLPIGVAANADPGTRAPAVTLVVLLAAAVGAPFLVLSTCGPLLQRWFGATTHRRAHDPYFLFAAGNAGSFLALVGYPALVAPHLSVHSQLRDWSVAYCLWVLLVLGCALTVRRPEPELARATPAPRFPVGQQLRWVALAALASSLMLGTTTYLTTDLAPVPLLWVLPLGLYLLSFVVAFGWSREQAERRAPVLARAIPLLLLPAIMAPGTRGISLALLVTLYLALFMLVATAAHARLSSERPEVSGLTRFYLLVAVGGAVGGVVNGLLAPVLLNRMYEFPVALAATALLLPRSRKESWLTSRYGRLGTVLLVLCLAGAPTLLRGTLRATHLRGYLALAVAALVATALRRRPGVLALGIAAVLLAPLVAEPTLAATRSYFGVETVVRDGSRHVLRHGTTVHGWQDLRASRRRLAQSYYERSGPIGQLLAARAQLLAHGRLGVVGLGSGALAAYGQPGETIRFFEIDPEIISLARDPRLFTYLADSPAHVQVVLGDGRLSLAKEAPRSFDVLVLDAFTSDAVPVHLLTREAVHLYLSRLRPGGVVAIHVSNRYLDLERVLADVAAAEGATGLAQNHPGDTAAGGVASRWVVLARSASDLSDLSRDPRWEPLERHRSTHRPWSDDYSDLLGALR
jgi:hypothetical protein